MAKANKSRYAILGILANAPGSSGYDIRSIMKGSTDFFWQETFSSIYPVLDVLEEENLIAEIEGSTSGRRRKSYKITKEGLKALQSWLIKDVDLEQSRNELLLKIFFGDLNSISSSIEHLENYKHKVSERLLILKKTRKGLPEEYPNDKGLPFWMITVEFGIRRMQASIKWAEYALENLSKVKKA